MSEATPRISEYASRGRWIILGIAVLILSALVISLNSGRIDSQRLSIHNPHPEGAMALSEVLKQRGVNVRDIFTTTDAASLTSKDLLVVVNSREMKDKTLREVLDTRTNILFLGTFAMTNRLEPYVRSEASSSDKPLPARCDFSPAAKAGTISATRGSLRALRKPSQACFPLHNEAFAYLQFERTDGFTLEFLSESNLASNQGIVQDSNAAFLLNLLSRARTIGWVQGENLSKPGEDSKATFPPAFGGGLIVFFAALLVFALSLGRRLGRVVVEDIPVVVHGAESVFGRAGLYREARSLEAPAMHARSYTARELGETLHLSTLASPEQMVKTISDFDNIPASSVKATLYGEAPRNGTELSELLQRLTDLVQRTHRKEQQG